MLMLIVYQIKRSRLVLSRILSYQKTWEDGIRTSIYYNTYPYTPFTVTPFEDITQLNFSCLFIIRSFYA